MKIYPCLSYHREINETNVNYTCNWQKVWDSSDSLNGNGCTLLIFIWSTIPLISGDFLSRWNAITVRSLRKGKEKGQFWGISYFWIEVFLKEVLGLFRSLTLRRNHLHSTFQVKARLYVNFIAVRKYNFSKFSRFFFVLFCVQNLCCNDSKYHSLKLKGRFSHECWHLWERAVQFLVFLGVWHLQTPDRRLQTADHRLQIVN